MGGTRFPGEAALLQVVPALEALDPGEPTKMPLEARMYGIFAAFIIAWAWALAAKRGRAVLMPPPWMMFTCISLIAVMGFDGVNATLYDLGLMGVPIPYLYEPRLDLRLATGLLSGIGIAGIMLPLVNYALWRNGHAQHVIANVRELAALVALNALLYALVASQSGLFFYPTSLIGVLGVIALIGALNLVLLVSLFRRDAAASNWRELLNPVAGALFLTALELGALSALRYAVFGFAEIP